MVTIYGWTQDGFNAWDILAFAPGVSSAMVRKVTGTIADMASYSSKMLRQYNKYDDGVESLYKRITAGFGYGCKPRILSNFDARQWHLDQEASIPNLIDKNASLKEQVKQAFELRNQFRTRARELMADRATAESLNVTDPNITWEAMLERQIEKGLSGDAIWRGIIESSQRSRQSVNKSLGL